MHRLYLATDSNKFRKFYWFEVKDFDLYFGPSSKRLEAYCKVTDAKLGKFSINTPPDFKEMKLSQTKYSYHQSGQFHAKKLHNGSYCLKDFARQFEKPEELIKPVRIFNFISKEIGEYKSIVTNPQKNEGTGQAILIENGENIRLYFEIFLVPSGVQTFPPPIIDYGKDKQIYMSKVLSTKFGLLFRHTKIANFHGDFSGKEIILLE